MNSTTGQPTKTIRDLREARGWTQRDVAVQLGVHATMVLRWERGDTVPRARNQQRLAVLFGVPVHEIAFGQGEEQG